MEIVGLYCRVSTTEQMQEGYSLGEQEKRLRLYCESHGWTVGNCYTDGGFSGAKMDRPALQSLIRDVKKHAITKVVVYKLDRLSRSQRDTLYLIEDVFLKNHVDFVSMSETLDTSTPFGIAMIGILSVFAQLERETIKERMTIGRNARIADGFYKGSGNIPIGYRYVDRELLIDEYEAQKVREIFTSYAHGETLSSIARNLTTEKFRNKSWTSDHLKRIMQNPIYIGLQRWNGQELPMRTDSRIITDDLFNAVQTELQRRSQKQDKPQSQHTHTTLLGGLLWCGKCGARYAGCSDKSKGKRIHRYYCYTRLDRNHGKTEKSCDNRSWRSDALNSLVLGEIQKLTVDRSIFENTPRNEETAVKRASIESRIKEIDKQLDKIIDLYSLGTINIQTIQRRSEALNLERDQLTEQLQKIKVPSATDRTVITKALDNFTAIIDNASEDKLELYNIVRTLIKSVIVTDDEIEINWNL